MSSRDAVITRVWNRKETSISLSQRTIHDGEEKAECSANKTLPRIGIVYDIICLIFGTQFSSNFYQFLRGTSRFRNYGQTLNQFILVCADVIDFSASACVSNLRSAKEFPRSTRWRQCNRIIEERRAGNLLLRNTRRILLEDCATLVNFSRCSFFHTWNCTHK